MKWKVIGTLLFFVCAISIFFCGVVATNIFKDWSRDVINADTVYDTQEFHEFFGETLDQAVQADIYYRSEERIAAGEVVDRDKLISGFKRYYGIVDGVITGNTEINDTYDGLNIYGSIPDSLQENLAEYEGLVESRLPSYYQMYLQRQLDEYKNCVRYLEGMKNFLYYVEDENGNIMGGNASKSEIGEAERTLVLSAGFSSDYLGKNPYYLMPMTILFWSRAIISFLVLSVTLCCRGMPFMICGRISAMRNRAFPFCLGFLLFPCWVCWSALSI